MSSGNWYQKERGKAALADELRKLGWTIHGYTEDRSDARSDYYGLPMASDSGSRIAPVRDCPHTR